MISIASSARRLRREPDERYASVDAFADDVRAFLDSRPVRARSGNAWYRTRKFLRRYWAPAAAAALVFASLADRALHRESRSAPSLSAAFTSSASYRPAGIRFRLCHPQPARQH